MNLKLVLKETGQSWTLEPTRDYFVGSDRTCDINLSQYPDVASRHLRLSCDRVSNVWYVEDLGTTVGTYIDGEAISRSLIEQSISIRLANKIVITAEPFSASVPVSAATTVSSAPATVGRSSSYNTEEVRNPGFRDVVKEPVVGRSGFSSGGQAKVLPEASISRPIDRKVIRKYFECMKIRNSSKLEEEAVIKRPWINFIRSIEQKKYPESGILIYILLGLFLIFFLFQATALILLLCVVILILCIAKVNRNPELPDLPVSEKQIDIWLMQDFEGFIEESRQKLKILTSDEAGSDTQNVLVAEDPIMMLSPIEATDNSAKSGYVVTMKESEENKNKQTQNIARSVVDRISSLDDFFFEKGIDKISRGSLNDFIVIFLCKNFISYCRGNWNSIEGFLLDEVTAEFMYDSIASIKTFENSNIVVTKQRNGERIGTEKIVFEEVLTFSTADGARTSFAINNDVKKYFRPSSDNDISTARESAELMRREIRQRRIDVQIVKDQTT